MPHQISSFLPVNFVTKPIGLIAGKGLYPILIAKRIRAAGMPLRVISFINETDQNLLADTPKGEQIQIKVGQLGKLLKCLKKFGCGYAVMAGQVTPRKLFHGLHPDIKALNLIKNLEIKNAETIFGAIASEIEKLDIKMLDARCFLDDQLANEGAMTLKNSSIKQEYIEHGIKIAKGIAELNIGQSAVVCNGSVIAVEAYEGTNSMLRRSGTFKTEDPIFVKVVKPFQDYRFDVPVIGEHTLDVMHDANVRTAVLEVDRVVMLDKRFLIKKANCLGIDLIGFKTL